MRAIWPRPRVWKVMEAIAAAAIALAFIVWRFKNHSSLTFDLITYAIVVSSIFLASAALSGTVGKAIWVPTRRVLWALSVFAVLWFVSVDWLWAIQQEMPRLAHATEMRGDSVSAVR